MPENILPRDESDIFDILLDAVVIFDQNRIIRYANPAFSQLVETSLKRIIDKKAIFDLIQFEDKSLFVMPEGVVGRDDVLNYREVIFQTETQSNSVVQLALRPYRESLWLLIMRDMSLEIKLQNKYQAQLKEKEDVIKELQDAKVQLEDYGRGLQSMVDAKTDEFKRINRFLDTMINSLNQGLFVFGRSLRCLPIYTKACVKLFEMDLTNQSLLDVLKLQGKTRDDVSKWAGFLFDGLIPFKDAAKLGPNFVSNGKEYLDPNFKYIVLEYLPMKNEQGNIDHVVVVATDRSQEIRASKAFQEKESNVNMIMKIVERRRDFLNFMGDFKEKIREMEFLTRTNEDCFDYKTMMGYLHSLKGGAGMYHMLWLQQYIHQFESEVSEYVRPEGGTTLIQIRALLNGLKREFIKFLKECEGFIGAAIIDEKFRVEIPMDELQNFSHLLRQHGHYDLEKIFEDKFLKEKIGNYFLGFADLIQELAARLGKRMLPLQIIGGDLMINMQKYQEVIRSLVHIFRNAIDHGIESPDEREKHGKAIEGKMSVSFKIDAVESVKKLVIQIKDDGRGISPDAIRETLKKNNKLELLSEPDDKIILHIFDDSFSTSETVSNISGRGVGLGSVRALVMQLGGQIELSTELNKFTCFQITLPIE